MGVTWVRRLLYFHPHEAYRHCHCLQRGWPSLLSPDSMAISTGMSEGLQPSLLNHMHPFPLKSVPFCATPDTELPRGKLRSRLPGRNTPRGPGLPSPLFLHPIWARPAPHREFSGLPTPHTPARHQPAPGIPSHSWTIPAVPPFSRPLSSWQQGGRCLKHRFSIKALLQLTSWASSAGHRRVFKAL